MHKILYRPIVIISLTLGVLVMVELVALGGITWRNLNRIDRIKQDIIQGHEVEQLTFQLLQGIDPSGRFNRHKVPIADLHEIIDRLFVNPQAVDRDTGEFFNEIKNLSLNVEHGKPQDLLKVLEISQKLHGMQRENEETLLAQVYGDSRLELNFAVLIPIVILLPAFLLSIWLFRRQILSPLYALESLLERLTKGDRQPFADADKEPVMQPLFNSYNRLITRLQELEEEHLNHTQTLEREVRNAAHALLEQSHKLARSERLAAVGELAASAAHELRNPLAGIQAALENMHEDCKDQDMGERLRLVSTEVKRLTHNLNDLLAISKQPPEPARQVDIAELIQELVTLIKYQVNENILLNASVPANLYPVLPETEFRQALLNLLLNSVQELGKTGGNIDLTVVPTSSALTIEVSDTGKGFPQALLEQGVRPFASYHEHGTGLGLAMVQRFARSLDGQLILQNSADGHACATLILPMQT